MKYAGGKHRLKKWLSDNILPYAKGKNLVEPFCGMLNATMSLQPAHASDASKPVITLIDAVRNGWEPPDTVSEEEYHEAKRGGGPMEAFCGFGCSWGGKFFGGYAKDDTPRNYALQAKKGIIRKVKATKNVKISCRQYFDVDLKNKSVIYCDPPYIGTTSAYTLSSFDHGAFWEWCRYASKQGNTVFVSEFTAPSDVEIFNEIKSSTMMADFNHQKTSEKLFILRG